MKKLRKNIIPATVHPPLPQKPVKEVFTKRMAFRHAGVFKSLIIPDHTQFFHDRKGPHISN
jgi:hypothetical protein